MKKQTRQRLMAVSILLLLSLSSIAFVFSAVTQPQQQISPLTSYVVEGDIDPQLETLYIQNGWTFLKVYNNGTLGPDVVSFINQAPTAFATSQGQPQMVVQKLNNPRNYAVITNLNGETAINNVTIDDLYTGLCNNLMALPAECVLIGLNMSGF